MLFRSCWEYHTDPEQFQTLLSELSTAEIAVYNPIVAIEWNMHKSHLLDLFAAGIPIPSTTVVTAGDEISLESVMDRQGLSKSVIKPAIGASSTGVWQCSREEPVSAFDLSTRAKLLNLFVGIQERLDLTYLVISHDLGVIKLIADRVAVMYDGRVVERGHPDRILDQPAHSHTAALVAAATSNE